MPDEIKYFSASDLYDNLYKQKSVEEEEKKSILERGPLPPPGPRGVTWSDHPERAAEAAEQKRLQEEHEARINKPRWSAPVTAVGGRNFERESAKKLAMDSKISVAPLQFNEDGSIDVGRNIDRDTYGAYWYDFTIGTWTEGKIDPDRYAGYHITQNSDDNTAIGDEWLEDQAVLAERKVRETYPDQPFDRERFKKQLKAFALAKSASNLAKMRDPSHDNRETVYQMVNGMPDDEKADFFEAMLNVSNENQMQEGFFGRAWHAFYEKGFIETGESIGGAATQLGQWIGLVDEDTEQEKLDQAEIDFAEYLIERQRKITAPTDAGFMGLGIGAGIEGAVTGGLEIAPGMLGGMGTGALAKKGAETALKVGAKGAGRAAVAGSTTFWWAQSKDAIYDTMIENGASTDSANAVSSIAAIPVAAIERFQVKSVKSAWFKNLKPKQQQSLKQAFDVVKQRNTSMSQNFIQGGKHLWKGTKANTINAAKETAQEIAQESLTMIGEHIGNEINDLDVPIDVKGRIMDTWEATGSSMFALGVAGRSFKNMKAGVDNLRGKGRKDRVLNRIATKAAIRETAGEEIANAITENIASGYQSEDEEERLASDRKVGIISEWVGDPSKENTEKLNKIKVPYEGENVGLGDFLTIAGKATGKKKAIEILRNSVGEKIGDKIVAGEVLQEKIDAIEKDLEVADGQAQKIVEAMMPYIAEDNKLKEDAIELVRAAKTSRNAFREFILSDQSVFNPDGSINSEAPRGRMILSMMEAMQESERDAQQDADVLAQMEDGGKFISPSLLMQMEKGDFEKWAVEQGATQQELSVHSREKLIDKYSEWANTRERLRFLLPTNLEKAGLKTNLQREAFSDKLRDALVDTVENVESDRNQEVQSFIEKLLQQKRKEDLRNVIQGQADELAVDQELEFEEGTEEAELLGEMREERVEQGELIAPESIQGVKEVALRELESEGVSPDVVDQITKDLDAIDSRDPIKRNLSQQRVMTFLDNQSLDRKSRVAKKDFVQDEDQLKTAKQMGDQFRELVDAGYLENLTEWSDFDVEAMWDGSDLNTDAVFGTAVEVMLRQSRGEQLTDNQINEIIFEHHTGNKIQYRDTSKKKAKKKKGDKQNELFSQEEADQAAEPQIVSAFDDIKQLANSVGKISTLISDQEADEEFNEIADDIIQTAIKNNIDRESLGNELNNTNLHTGEKKIVMDKYNDVASSLGSQSADKGPSLFKGMGEINSDVTDEQLIEVAEKIAALEDGDTEGLSEALGAKGLKGFVLKTLKKTFEAEFVERFGSDELKQERAERKAAKKAGRADKARKAREGEGEDVEVSDELQPVGEVFHGSASGGGIHNFRRSGYGDLVKTAGRTSDRAVVAGGEGELAADEREFGEAVNQHFVISSFANKNAINLSQTKAEIDYTGRNTGSTHTIILPQKKKGAGTVSINPAKVIKQLNFESSARDYDERSSIERDEAPKLQLKNIKIADSIPQELAQQIADAIKSGKRVNIFYDPANQGKNIDVMSQVLDLLDSDTQWETTFATHAGGFDAKLVKVRFLKKGTERGAPNAESQFDISDQLISPAKTDPKAGARIQPEVEPEQKEKVPTKRKQKDIENEKFPDAETIEMSDLEMPRFGNALEQNRLTNEAQRVQSIAYFDTTGKKRIADVYQDLDSDGNKIYKVYREPLGDGKANKMLVKGVQEARTIEQAYDLLLKHEDVKDVTGISKLEVKAPTLFQYESNDQRKEIHDSAQTVADELNKLINEPIWFGNFDKLGGVAGKKHSPENILRLVKEQVGDNPDYAIILLDQIKQYALLQRERLNTIFEEYWHYYGAEGKKPTLSQRKVLMDKGGTVGLSGTESGYGVGDKKRTTDKTQILIEAGNEAPAFLENESGWVGLTWEHAEDIYFGQVELKQELVQLRNDWMDPEYIIGQAQGFHPDFFYFDADENGEIKIYFKGEEVTLGPEQETSEEDINAALLGAAAEQKEFQQEEQVGPQVITNWETEQLEESLKTAASYGNAYLDILGRDEDYPLTSDQKFDSSLMDTANAASTGALGDGDTFVLQTIQGVQVDTTASKKEQRNDVAISLVWNKMHDRYSVVTTYADGEHYNSFVAVNMARDEWINKQAQEQQDLTVEELSPKDLKMWQEEHRKHIEEARKVLPDSQFPSIVQAQYPDLFNKDYIKQEEVLEKAWGEEEIEQFDEAIEIVVDDFIDNALLEANGDPKILRGLIKEALSDYEETLMNLVNSSYKIDNKVLKKLKTEDGVAWILDNWHGIVKRVVEARKEDLKRPESFLTAEEDREVQDLKVTASNLYAAVVRAQEVGDIEKAEKLLAAYEEAQDKAEEAERKYNEKYDPEAEIEETPKDRTERLDKEQAELEQQEQQEEDLSYREGLWMPKPVSRKERVPAKLEFRSERQRIAFEDGDPYNNTVRQKGSNPPGVYFIAEYENGFILLTEKEYNARYGWAHSYNKAEWHRFEGGKRYLVDNAGNTLVDAERNSETGEWVEPETNLGEFLGFAPVSESRYGKAAILHESGPFYYNDKLNENSKFSATAERLKHVQKIYELLPIDITEGARGQDVITGTVYNDIILSATSIAGLVSEGKSWQEAFEEVVGESDKVAADIKKFTGLEAGELFKQIMEGPDPSKPLKAEGGFELGREMREQGAPEQSPLADVDVNEMPDDFQLEQEVERPPQPKFDNTGKGSEKRMFEGMDADPKQIDLDFEASITVPDKLAKQVMANVAKLTAADIQEAFPGSVVTETEFGFEIKLGENRVPIVLRTAVDISEQAARKIWNDSYSNLPDWQGYSEDDFVEILTGEGARGKIIIPTVGRSYAPKMQRLGILGLMELKAGLDKAETLRVIRHELVHLAFDTGLWTEQEKAALVQRFSDPNASQAQQSEDIAQALEYWKEPGVFQKFADWINKILHKLTGGTLTLSNSDVQRLLTSESVWQGDPTTRFKPENYSDSDAALSVQDPESSPYLEKKKELKKVKRAIARAAKKGDDVLQQQLMERREDLIVELEEIIRENARNIPGMRQEQMDIDGTVLENLAKEFDVEYDKLTRSWLKRRFKMKHAIARIVDRTNFAKTIKEAPENLTDFIFDLWDIPEKNSSKRMMMRQIREAKMGFMNYHNQLRARRLKDLDKARKKLTSKDLNPVLKEYFFKYLTGTKGLMDGKTISDALLEYIPDASKRESIETALREYEEALNEARKHIDALAEEGINIGLFHRPDGDGINLLELTIDENLGYYINRSYAFFENPEIYNDFLQNTEQGQELIAAAARSIQGERIEDEKMMAGAAAKRELFKKDGVFYKEGQLKRKKIRAEIKAVIKGLTQTPDGKINLSKERIEELREKMESDAFKKDGPKFKSIVTQEMARYKESMLETKEGKAEIERQLDQMERFTEQDALDEANRIVQNRKLAAMGGASSAEQDLGILQERKHLNKAFLDLYGENRDVKTAYATTVGKMAQMISVYKLQQGVLKNGLFKGMIRPPGAGSRRNMQELIGPQWGPLQDHWVHEDALEVIKELSGQGNGTISKLLQHDGWFGYAMVGAVAMSNAARMNKTVLSVKTVSRNMTEALMQGFINGSFSLSRLAESYATAMSISGEKNATLKWTLNPTVASLDKLLSFSKDYKVDEELATFLVKTGVVGNDDWRVIQDQIAMTVAKYENANSLLPKDVEKEMEDKTILEKLSEVFKDKEDTGKLKPSKKTKKARRRRRFEEFVNLVTNNKLVRDQGSMYRVPDDVLKINTFLTEVSILNRAYKGTVSRKKIWEEAAERTKRTTPTATRVPRAIRELSVVPLVGNFPVWTTSFMQSVWGAYSVAYEDMKSGNPELARSGRWRVARMGVVQAIIPAIAAIATSLMFDDEDEDDIRSMLPEWSKNHTILPYFDKDGVLQVIDFTQTLPHVMFWDWGRAGVSGMKEGWDSGGALDAFHGGVSGAFEQFMDPYTDEDVFWQTFPEIMRGTNQFGKEIYSPFDSNWDKIAKSAEYVTIGGRGKGGEFSLIDRDWRGPLAPGTIAEMRRTYEAFWNEGNPRSPIKRTKLGQASRFMIGTEIMQINVKNQLTVKYSEFKRKYNDSTAHIRRSGYSASSDIFESQLAEFRKEEQLLHKELLSAIGGARMAGMSDIEIVRALKEYGATNIDLRHWINGVSRDYVPGRDTLRSIFATEGGEEKVKALIKRGDRNE